MGFWDSKTGAPITGNAQDSFAGNFANMPDGTQAVAMIKSFEPKDYDGKKSYQIVYKITDGDFTGCGVKQTIDVFNEDKIKAQRALNMFKRVYDLCGYVPTHNDAPSKEELSAINGKLLSIQIGNGIMGDGAERTWVREVHAAGSIETLTGVVRAKEHRPSNSPVETAFSRNQKSTQSNELLDDIPF